jgi:type IV pilus assembly protein PilB
MWTASLPMGCVMTDVDATRWRASEHDLEFIDLDTYGVDPAARDILPAPLARRLQVAAVKRRFGTPVIATADPDDLMAQDSVRAALGRDFISVVATNDQIGAYLDRLYGSDGPYDEESTSESTQAEGVLELALSGPEAPKEDEDNVEPARSSFESLMDLANVTTESPSPKDESGQPETSRNVLQVPDIAPLPTLPALIASPVTDGEASNDELAARAAELARSMRSDPDVPVASPDLTADLVDEAVSSYQEQRGEEHGESSPPVSSQDITQFPPLAKALVEGDRVSISDMESVLEEHARSEQSVARILTARGLVTEADLMWGMAEEMGLEFVDLDLVGVNFTEVGLIPESTARHHNVIVIAKRDGTPVVAASNPTDVFAMDDLRTIIGRSFIVVVATRSQITSYIGRAFNSGGDASDMAREASLGIDGADSDNGVDDIQAVTEEAPIVRYVNLLILQALNERASDIHIEPTEHDLRIRYRIDGVLHDVSTAPRSIAPAVTTRLKVMADMNIAEHRIPQDGRISLNVGSKGIDLRMATLPTIYGEKVVMRVLDKSSVVLGFADLGFEDHLLKVYESIYTKPYGTILVTGPTGSGKSTTLYTTLTALNSPEKNIITVEDPVELPLKGVNQVQLNLKAGLNFASALRAILRSDPDIVLVGEIRDKETAVIAIEAALTGHMVLATLHTNNAASTPMRLIEMGLEPFLVTSSVSGVLAQRLARRLCIHCKQAYKPTEAEIVAAGWSMEEVEAMGGLPEVFKAVGCSACANTGYRGRKALAELLPMSEEIERSIIEGGSVDDIHRIAVAQGMTTLRQSGLRKAMEGETTLEEVLRVVA